MKISALDENGKPVDWWFMYKVPELGSGALAGTEAASGYEYVYYDSAIDQLADRDPNKKVTKSPNLINKDQGALNNTLDQGLQEIPEEPGPDCRMDSL